MKFISLIFFITVSAVCNAQLSEYRMLFPFPYNGDSIAIKQIHQLKIKTFYSKEALTTLTQPDLVTFFRFDDSGKLLSKRTAACDSCKTHPVFIAHPDSATINSHKAMYNKNGQLAREISEHSMDTYGYDKLGRISYHAFIIPISIIDTSYDCTYHHYADHGKPDWSIRFSFILHTNVASGLRDTVSSRKSYARYLYKGGRLFRVLADLPTKISGQPRFVLNYKYISKSKWEVYFFNVEEDKNTCVWKVEEK